MEKPGNYLFIYGTLLQSENLFAAYLKANSVFYSKAKVKGMMYDIGLFPGVILNAGADSYVHGNIVFMNDPEAVLKKLDVYEGFGPDEPQPNMFVRELVAIELAGETLSCWIYLYNLPVTGFLQIASGDYLAYNNH